MSIQLPTLRDFAREEWPQDRITEIELEGRQFYLRHVRGSVFFRIENLNSAFTGAVFAEQPLNSASTPDEERARFLDGWRQVNTGRLLDLPDPLNLQSPILCAVSQTRFWLLSEYQFETWTNLSQPLPLNGNELWKIPEADLIALLSRDWNNANSPPRRALEWHQLAHEEKQWAQLSWARGSREELENLTCWMAHSDAELWQERPLWGINYEFWSIGTAEIKSVRGRTILRPPSARLTRLGALFLQANQAALQRPPLMPTLTPDRSYSPDHYAFIHLRFTTPSPDEVAEARFNLRAWLKGRMHDIEIDELVPML